jgi:hypothetical protein
MLDIRRGISRVGVVLFVLWELVVLSGLIKDHNAPFPHHEPIGTYIGMAVLPPLLVWVCWRTVLWIVRGFMSERAR